MNTIDPKDKFLNAQLLKAVVSVTFLSFRASNFCQTLADLILQTHEQTFGRRRSWHDIQAYIFRFPAEAKWRTLSITEILDGGFQQGRKGNIFGDLVFERWKQRKVNTDGNVPCRADYTWCLWFDERFINYPRKNVTAGCRTIKKNNSNICKEHFELCQRHKFRQNTCKYSFWWFAPCWNELPITTGVQST